MLGKTTAVLVPLPTFLAFQFTFLPIALGRVKALASPSHACLVEPISIVVCMKVVVFFEYTLVELGLSVQ